ncbi:MAG: UDP-3-O-acyl-N-acetylglucosamine deacetylase [Helicobacteraceae bacterium]|jgi:UDP-3-O-[3-hydroxymyristoyl] N-acetylglucosamine deacetylase|nr:UDP-3-O-acyl-N-acetylglucosamine deacetylase [Helicobacteraceae bacterium]
MKQRTIAKSVEIMGVGLHSGNPVRMRLNPAPADSGIVFVREDVNRQIKVAVENVTDTRLATVIANGDVSVSTIEHLLSAVIAMGIDNLEVVLDSDEVPIMDGSSASFCILFEEAGTADQNAVKRVLLVKKPIEIRDGGRFVRLSPGKINEIRFEIRFDHPAISRQEYRFVFSKENYIKEIARARTFGFLKEANYLRSIGKGLGGGLDNAVVLDEKRVLNAEGLRFADEFVRHKILDAIGDMAFLGAPFLGKYEAFAGSHHLNHLLTKSILSDSEAFEIVESESVKEAEKELERVFA